MLQNKTLFGEINKVKDAIENLKRYEPDDGYYLAFSGGKDSCVIKALADLAHVRYDAHYSVTTIDPPELIKFIRVFHRDVIWDRPKIPFMKMIVKKGFPMRRSRWCCEIYKERGGKGRVVLTGIRKEESSRRRNRKLVESCWKKEKDLLNIIIDWTEQDVWEFINKYKIPYCTLYNEGFKRIGCVGCPMTNKRKRSKEIDRWPVYRKLYIRAFNKLYEDRKTKGTDMQLRFSSGEDMFEWWLSGKPYPKLEQKQRSLFK